MKRYPLHNLFDSGASFDSTGYSPSRRSLEFPIRSPDETDVDYRMGWESDETDVPILEPTLNELFEGLRKHPEQLDEHGLKLLGRQIDWPEEQFMSLKNLVYPSQAIRNYVEELPVLSSIQNSAQILRQLIPDTAPDKIIAIGDGGVGFAWPRMSWYVDITFENDGLIWLKSYRGKDPSNIKKVSDLTDAADSLIEVLRDFIGT